MVYDAKVYGFSRKGTSPSCSIHDIRKEGYSHSVYSNMPDICRMKSPELPCSVDI